MAPSPIDLLNHDILARICHFVAALECDVSYDTGKSLRAFSATNKRHRDLALPYVFQIMTVRGDGWETALKRIVKMERYPAAVPFIRTFKVDINLSNPGTFQNDIWITRERMIPPKSVPSSLARLFGRLENLTKLVLVLPVHHSDAFAKEFKASENWFPRVETLVVGPFCDFAVAMCPNVKIIVGHRFDWCDHRGEERTYQLIEAVRGALKVVHFEVHLLWTSPLFHAVSEALPHIASLGVCGHISSDTSIFAFTQLMHRFKALQHLAIGDASAIGSGFDLIDCCCDETDMSEIEKWKKQEHKEQREAEMRVAKSVLSACATLKDVWVGDEAKADAIRDEGNRLIDVLWHYEPRDKVVKWPRP